MLSQPAVLTICIPTYNRPSLVSTVEALLPQLTAQVQIKVFDNCSEVPAVDLLRTHLSENVTVVRGNINVGAAGNIIKCFEYCDTEWMWLLSDDDQLVPTAVATILDTITRHPNVAYVKFNSDVGDIDRDYQQEVLATGQREFIEKMQNFGNILFLSSAVYNVWEVRKAIKAAYYFTPTFSPQVVFPLAYLAFNPHGKALFSPASIANWGGPAHATWDYNLVNKSLSDMVYVVQGTAERKMLFEKINARHPIRGTFKINGVQRLAKLLWMVALAQKQREQPDMLADYYTSRSFIYWSENSNRFLFLLKMMAVSGVLLLLNLPLIGQLIGLLAGFTVKAVTNNQAEKVKFIYNRFAFYNKDFRL